MTSQPPIAIHPDLAAVLRRATNVAVLTGAGVSSESGVPTFRDALTGLWENFKPEDLATPEAFLRNPPMVWKWYMQRRKTLATVEPNPGHVALAEVFGRAKRRLTPPSGTAMASRSSHCEIRAKPCVGSPSRGPNHGKITGMPPRIGCSVVKRLHWLEIGRAHV